MSDDIIMVDESLSEISEIELCRQDLIQYCIAQYPSFVFPQHILIIAEHLEKVARGEINRLMIFAPPRHGKSELVSKLFPAWYIGFHKGKNTVAVTTYGQDLSNEIGRALQARMNSETYAEIFPESVPSDNANAITRLVTVNGGGFLTVGIGGALTGKGAHLRICDDPNKNREEADSDTEQEKQWSWWTSVFMTRGEPNQIGADGTSNDEDSPIILILTRWSDKDIAKKLIEQQKEEMKAGLDTDRWTILDLDAICEEKKDFFTGEIIPDPLGRPIVPDPADTTTWEDKHALWPEKYSAKRLAKLRHAVGIRDWNALYQQHPSSATGDIYLRSTWQFYQVGGIPPDASRPVQSWDCNYKVTESSDFVSGLVGRVRKKTSVYLMDRFRGRWKLAVLCQKLIEAKKLYPETSAIYIEEKANGQPVIETLSKEIPGIIAVEPRTLGSKDARNEAAAKYQNAGNIYLPLGEPWVDEFIEELASYPNGAHDDDADAFAQLVLMELGQPSTDALIRFIENELTKEGIDVSKIDKTDPFSIYVN